MTSLVALEINNQNGIIPARTSQKITATAYPSRRVCYKFKLSYELFSMFGMFLNMITLHSESLYLNPSTLTTLRKVWLAIVKRRSLYELNVQISTWRQNSPSLKRCGSYSWVAVNWDSAVFDADTLAWAVSGTTCKLHFIYSALISL